MTRGPVTSRFRGGYTLIEILVAATLTLILMTAVVRVFSTVGNSINSSRRALETFDRLRAAAAILRKDLQGITVTMSPPVRPEMGQGYFEYIEVPGNTVAAMDLTTSLVDTSVGQLAPGQAAPNGAPQSDILMFTTRDAARPFAGRLGNTTTIQSDVAEVAWFLRGHNLHRRVLLVAPGAQATITNYNGNKQNFYNENDISVHVEKQGGNNMLVANTLASLTKRENRYAHPVDQFPFDAARWGQLGLPTMCECATTSGWMGGSWVAGSTPPPPASLPSLSQVDLWSPPAKAGQVNNWVPDSYLISNDLTTLDPSVLPTRAADDVVLTNVIGFDVKAWDYQAQCYVDLGGSAADGTVAVSFAQANRKPVNVSGNVYTLVPEYDTFSTSYENEGIYHYDNSGQLQVDIAGGKSANGFDDNNTGIVDSLNERITSPPYPIPLRGIQVKIRVFEPDSRQVREVTIEQDFLPK